MSVPTFEGQFEGQFEGTVTEPDAPAVISRGELAVLLCTVGYLTAMHFEAPDADDIPTLRAMSKNIGKWATSLTQDG